MRESISHYLPTKGTLNHLKDEQRKEKKKPSQGKFIANSHELAAIVRMLDLHLGVPD